MKSSGGIFALCGAKNDSLNFHTPDLSAGKLKSVFYDFHIGAVFFRTDRHHIKTCFCIAAICRFEIMKGGQRYFFLLSGCDSPFGISELAGSSGFDLDENNGVAVFCNNIYFTFPNTVIPLQNDVSVFLKISDGKRFALFAELPGSVEHDHLPCDVWGTGSAYSFTPLKVRRWMGQQPNFRMASLCARVG